MNFEKLAQFLKLKKRTIYRGDNTLYLTRFYVFRKPRTWLPSIYIHCFHASDEDQELHNHPWRRSLSLILSGVYKEEFRDKNNKVQTRILSPGRFNYIPANKFHRVDLITPTVWTLFISGERVQRWGFWNRDTGEYTDWQKYLQLKQITKKFGKNFPMSLAELFGMN